MDCCKDPIAAAHEAGMQNISVKANPLHELNLQTHPSKLAIRYENNKIKTLTKFLTEVLQISS